MLLIIKKNNLSVLIAVKYQLKTAKSMVKTSSNLNVNSVAQLLNGSVGEIHISASLATKDSVLEIM